MPTRDAIHSLVRQALIKDGWTITADPYIISYGERFLFVDLGATKTSGAFIGAQRGAQRIVVEIKELRGQSVMVELEQAIGQYVLYRLLMRKIDPERDVYLAVTDLAYDELFGEPIGEVVLRELPLQMLVVNMDTAEIQQWIPPLFTAKL